MSTLSDRERVVSRLRICEEETVERPYRAPIATMWYAEDVAYLMAELVQIEKAFQMLIAVTGGKPDGL